ncbi:DUF7322 domain-containing protein [Salinirussus salinus]|uniref:DUF7322 domain-containing protein n=1 Tax=Salinirussus salinus TaxID=1198300 RepID=UPI001357ACB8|nr:hypothetical protein [Salinirussus salinus]
MPDDEGTDGEEEGSPGDWQAVEQRYDAEPDPEEFEPGNLGPEIPEAPDLTEVEASSEVRYRFWALVMVFNVALLAASVGVMFVAFQGEWELGGQLTLAGLALFGFGYYRYRQTKAVLAEKGEEEQGESEGSDRNG